MSIVIAIRNATATAWQTANPVLASGEMSYVTDEGAIKIGDGETNWVDLPYLVEGNEVRAETTSKINKSVVYYDSDNETFKADSNWTTTTITDGGGF